MQLSITGRNMEITDYIREYLDKRMQRITRHLPSLHEGRVELAAISNGNGQRHSVEVTLRAGGKILRGEERAADLFTAIDDVMEKMVRQVDRFKGKRQQRRHVAQTASMAAVEAPDLDELAAEADEEVIYSPIVKMKRFQTAPMHPEEAIEQMELLGHNFFVFFNAQDGQLNVVYRRHDGDYGLLIPELA